MTLNIKATIQIQKPINEIFENMVNPDKMTQYFIESSTGRITEKAELIWTFPEFDEKCPITIGQCIPNKK
ncbi:MAG TPA: hypothetical protein VKY34_01600 [Xanthomarina sp.]|nr:hypothetical protein [Xanthomarina sp.]